MQKWEYCAISGITTYYGRLGANGTALWHFTENGIADSEIEALNLDDYYNGVAKTIAQLGEQGWEMVGTGRHNGARSRSYSVFQTPFTLMHNSSVSFNRKGGHLVLSIMR